MPRGVAANSRSSATTFGRRFVITSRAIRASASVKDSSSPTTPDTRSFSAGRISCAPMSTVHGFMKELSICHNPRVIQPPYRDVTVGDLLARLARALPDGDALVFEPGPRYTFAALEQEVRTIARGLIALGVEPGERVVLWATNVPEWVVLQFALAKIGAVLVTANTSLRARDIDYLLRQCEAATLVTIRGFRDVDYITELASAGELPHVARRIFVPRRNADTASDPTPAGYTPYDAVRDAASRVSDATLDARSRAVRVDDVINMQYTSG